MTTKIHSESVIKRFEAKYIPKPNSGCFLWLGAIGHKGTARFGLARKNRTACQIAYEIEYGPRGQGLCVRHKCDNPACVNPAHLELGTIADNNSDKMKRGRFKEGEATKASKLTAADVIEIRKRPTSQRKLAKQYGVTRRHILDIQKERYWKCLLP
jgi:hypothetical protein